MKSNNYFFIDSASAAPLPSHPSISLAQDEIVRQG